jgi:hypothetical protein
VCVEVPDQKGGCLIVDLMGHEVVKGVALLWYFVIDVDDLEVRQVVVVDVEDDCVGVSGGV